MLKGSPGRFPGTEVIPTPPRLVLPPPRFLPASGIASSSVPGICIPQCLQPAPRSYLPQSSLRPQHAIADSPGSPAVFHALLPSLRGARHPAAAFTPSLGGAGRGGACGSARLAPTLGSTALPAGEQRARLPRAKVRCLGPRHESVEWSENGLKGTARKCRERWRESREMWLLLAGREPQRRACGSDGRPALCSEPARG